MNENGILDKNSRIYYYLIKLNTGEIEHFLCPSQMQTGQ